MTARILITGAAGGVGTLMRPRLARADRVLRLLDIAAVPPAADGERVETVQASITDMAAMEGACSDVDAVIHLGGHSLERPWPDMLETNINGTYTVLEAARRRGVRRVVLASSNHAVGFVPRVEGQRASDYLFPRPDTYYGVSKVAVEALGSLYADRYGMEIICIRIGSCFERPKDVRMLATWLSPDDGARLFEACLAAPAPGFRIVWGVSDNTRRWFSLREARALGYEPQDDAERFAAEILGERGVPDPADPALRYLGGVWCGPDFDTAVKECQ
ncbi:NAD-dependent epimerase/dehydratase family protein [Gandjariella thermophila]|uniref:NAD-dependent dehydratase n=1 Tax=Gandjariella thermophila TaxID=1931992 RepID=A0A4D4JBR2_9PSEU|nr:NAD(P)-dependent oxidoreductase [Gandjariella thermophila]GDY33024.1 NAD-dependent dehydratase [Gandjariella thermophila]